MHAREVFTKHREFLLSRITELQNGMKQAEHTHTSLNAALNECNYHLELTQKRLDELNNPKTAEIAPLALSKTKAKKSPPKEEVVN